MIMDAKASKHPVVVMAFSSMPVPRARILELAIMMIEESEFKPYVIALVGNQNAIRPVEEHESLTDRQAALEEAAALYSRQGKLLVDAGAPFGKLFPQVDCVIAHGGLGTTGEILRAAKPCLTTGVLILDQRFWGRRVHELGCGPAPVHIRDLHKTLVQSINDCLRPGSKYAARAKEIAEQITDEDFESDGVAENVNVIVEQMEFAKPVKRHQESIMVSPQRLASALAADANKAVRSEMRYAQGQITSVVVDNSKEIRHLVRNWIGEEADDDADDDNA